nr:MAG TPA: hypothetical protein [Caudoviricetes sp.]
MGAWLRRRGGALRVTERLGAHCQGATGCFAVIRGGPQVVTLRAALCG